MKLSDQITRRHLFVAFGTSSQTGSLSSVDLAATRDDVTVALTASDGSVAPIAGADAATAGVMTAADKVRLDGLPPTTTREFGAFSEIPAASVAPAITHVRTAGRAAAGDGGGALYKRVAAEPAHGFKVQSSDGTWWEGVPEPPGIGFKQLGAVGDGVTDDTAAVLAAIDAAHTLGVFAHAPEGTYACTGMTLVGDLRMRGTGTLKLSGLIVLPDGAAELVLDGVTFDGSGIDNGNLFTPLTRVRVTDVTFKNGTGLQLDGGGEDIVIANSRFRDITPAAGRATAIWIGNNTYSQSFGTKKVRIYGNMVDNVSALDGVSQIKGIIVYGYEIAIFGNTISNVKLNTAGTGGGEAIYTKGVRVTVTGNTATDCDSGHNGTITLKGKDESDTTAPNGYQTVCADNVVSYTKDTTTKVRGIFVLAEKAVISSNQLRNCYIHGDGADDLQINGNSVHVDANGYAALCLTLTSCNNTQVSGNRFNVTVSNYDAALLYVAEHNTLGALSNFVFSGNSCVAWYKNSTDGSTATCFLRLQGVGTDTFTAYVMDNHFHVVSHFNFLQDMQAVFYQDASAFRGALTGNAMPYHSFLAKVSNSGFTPGLWNIGGNVVKDVPCNANRTILHGFDAVARNETATGSRTATLPAAKFGMTVKGIASSTAHTLTMACAGTDTFNDGATSKALAPGAALSVECFEGGVWAVTQASGSIT